MNVNEQISNAISSGETTARAWADSFITKQSQGDELGCCQLKLVVLTGWICTLSDYLDEAFDSDGNLVEEPNTCITLDEAMVLVGKINSLGAC